MSHNAICHSEQSEAATQPRKHSGRGPGFQSLVHVRTRALITNQSGLKAWSHASHFRCSASLNSPQDESAVADMTKDLVRLFS